MSKDKDVEDLKQRMTRIESRLCQLMLHLGLDPNSHEYDSAALSDDFREPVRKRTPYRVWRDRE